jgi:5-methylcytosine-specific restriction endonuclease McrA
VREGKLGVNQESYKVRYGTRQISDEDYQSLREDTPSPEIRDKINNGHDKTSVTRDKALPGKTFTGPLEADHIVPMDKITRMDGFGKLTREQQLEVLNNEENFVGLSKSANTSKGTKSYEEWTHYRKGKTGEIEVDPKFREEMMEKEKILEGKLQKQIDDFNKINNKK